MRSKVQVGNYIHLSLFMSREGSWPVASLLFAPKEGWVALGSPLGPLMAPLRPFWAPMALQVP